MEGIRRASTPLAGGERGDAAQRSEADDENLHGRFAAAACGVRRDVAVFRRGEFDVGVFNK